MIRLLSALLLGFMLASGGASAEVRVYGGIPLLGSEEVPKRFAESHGVFSAMYDEESNTLLYSFSWNLESGATAAHFHGPARRGENADAIVDLGPVSGRIGEKSGQLMLDDRQEAELLDGLWYINVHSKNLPAGEIRAQLVELSPAAVTAIYDASQERLKLNSIIVPGMGAFEVELDRIQGRSPLSAEVTTIQVRNFDLDGRKIFRYETFGDEAFWTDELRMHEVIALSISPMTALSVGLKVDAEVLPEGILEAVDLNDPATTVALLEMDAVVGVRGTVENGELVRVGITCALCHSDVDDSVMEGIGRRLDGYANRDLDPGAILALSSFFADERSQQVLTSWGPGRYDPRFNQDGINHPVLIPPIYGLEGVPFETYTGDGPVSYWNAYVAITQMGGLGHFEDSRIGLAVQRDPDLVTPKLPALLAYQESLNAPAPPEGSFDAEAAARGRTVFKGQGGCADCHYGPNFTDAADRLHSPLEVGMEALTAERSATGLYRTTPLRALWRRPPYFHDGSAATLLDVVEHYDSHFYLGLGAGQKSDLVEYLKSL